jgi:hypothetical protein
MTARFQAWGRNRFDLISLISLDRRMTPDSGVSMYRDTAWLQSYLYSMSPPLLLCHGRF